MTQQSFLSGAAIFAAPDLGHEDVEIPDWGGTVRVVQMNAAETADFTKWMGVVPPNEGMYLIVIFCVRNGQRERIFVFEDADPTVSFNQLQALIEQLKTKSMSILTELQKTALRVNKMGVVAKEALKKD